MYQNILTAGKNEIPGWLSEMIPGLLGFLKDLVLILIILVVGLKVIKLLRKLLAKALEKGNADPGISTFLGSLVKYALYAVLVLIILSQFGVTTSSVVAVLGSAGVTIGLALQGSLSNLAGGVLILLLKPFVIGDYIVEQATGQEGTVEAITIFYTRLLTTDYKRVMIPNGVLSNTSIINASAMDKRRLNIIVGVAYNSDLTKVKEILTDLVVKEEARLEDEPMNVFVSELADSCVQMGVRLWVKNEDYWTTKWRITENIKRSFDENGIEIPFPQLDVQIKQ